MFYFFLLGVAAAGGERREAHVFFVAGALLFVAGRPLVPLLDAAVSVGDVLLRLPLGAEELFLDVVAVLAFALEAAHRRRGAAAARGGSSERQGDRHHHRSCRLAHKHL